MRGSLETPESSLLALFKKTFSQAPVSIEALKGDGSSRKIFRLRAKNLSVIGVWGPERKENEAFLSFSRRFRKSGLFVPEIYAENLGAGVYLEEDLGDVTLFDYLSQNRSKQKIPPEVASVYLEAAEILPRFQVEAGKNLDYSACYPRSHFDKKSMLWDMNHFKYYFLTLAHIPFDEQALEEDFERFSDFLSGADSNYFLYRDFQSRNIMVCGGKPAFIDYQGGRHGALQYDIASLAFDAKANLSAAFREELLEAYLKALGKTTSYNRAAFMKYYPGFILIRILQALGAYGLRGFYERKTHFLQSIPFALKNLSWLLETQELGVSLPAFVPLLKKMASSPQLMALGAATKKLTVNIFSFSYPAGVPRDENGHGGGFVFDCRALPNPGRDKKMANLTGLDAEVISLLDKSPEVKRFLTSIFSIIDQSVENYTSRGFSNLFVAFGCTGGRHRSVYCAEKLAEHLRKNFSLNAPVKHLSLPQPVS